MSSRNERAIRNYCKDGKLEAGMTLMFRQMPNCQQEFEVSACAAAIVMSDSRSSLILPFLATSRPANK
jgi:hypothetical protein